MSNNLITRATFKRYLLNRAKMLRPSHAFTRVSEDTFIHFESMLMNAADSFIKSHPAKGTTLKP